jgi:glutamine---fructose-6-phosphate transaminase (isomerizing)
MNSMLAQIHSLPGLITEVTYSLDQEIRSKVGKDLTQRLERIYITGCGDSHHAALGGELAFEALTGLPTQALTALQFSRYNAPYLPQGAPQSNLVVGISVSGEVSRTLEALQQGKSYGAVALAMTADPSSRIGRAGDVLIDSTAPEFPEPPGVDTPGVRTFIVHQLALYLLAIRIGEARRQIAAPEAEGLRQELSALSHPLEKILEACDPAAASLAKEWRQAAEFVFTGSGPNYGSALFSAAKVLEASGDPAVGQDTEEWAHLQYFSRREETPTFIISAGGREISRSIEIAAAARAIGRRVAVIGPPNLEALVRNAEAVLPIPAGLREMFSPLVATVPGSLFAAYRAEETGEPFFRDFGGGRNVEDSGGASRIRTSEMLPTAETNDNRSI